MAELAVECPTPEGHVEFSRAPTPRTEPQTNLRIREFLKKHHKPVNSSASNSSAVDSETSSDDQQRQQANQSPPPNCSICLSRVKSKCFTDSCMHQFCFNCLLEWSKVSDFLFLFTFFFSLSLSLAFFVMMSNQIPLEQSVLCIVHK